MAAQSGTEPSWKQVSRTWCLHRDSTLSKVNPPLLDVAKESEKLRNVTGIPRQLLEPREVELTEMTTEALLEQLSSGRLLSTEVVNAFLRRAALAQKLTNCVTELLPERALKRAKFLDEYYAEHKQPIGPLHGLPISVKEMMSMKGLDVNAGWVAFVGTIAEDDSNILKILWRAGAVFHARTAEPQSLMHLECSNNITGVTVNPFNRDLTSGGSSGGEGALIGIRGSCLGIGTDIGGSIRGPAANNGLYGLRPSSYRLPVKGKSVLMFGNEQIIGVIGPLCTSLGGIKIFMKTILDAKPWLIEPSLIAMPWKDDVSYIMEGGRPKLKVAVLWSDEVVKPHPPIIRALKEVTEKLRNVEGVEVVDWKPYKHDSAWEIIASLYFGDGGKQLRDTAALSGEPFLPMTDFILTQNPCVKERTVTKVWELTKRREAYRLEYAQLWNKTATRETELGMPCEMVDVILCPAGPGAAPPLETAKYWAYTAQWNLLDYPSIAFPVTKVKPEIDLKEEGYKPMNEQDEFNYQLYEPEKYRDAPVSLQLVARRYEDEKLVEAMEFIEKSIGLPFEKFTRS